MILLDGHSLTPERKIRTEAMSIRIRERDSTAQLTPTPDSGISINDWLLDDEEPGAGIVWRVRNIQQAYATNTVTLQMEHVIATLKDLILFGEITPATITGVSGATTCTARQAVNYILGQQSDWVLDDFDYGSVSNPYKFDGDSLYDALEKVTNSLEDAWWSLNTTVYPFKISIIEKPDGVACEMREGRNLNAISRTIDMQGMFTRFYPIGKDDLHVTGNYVSKNENLYGTICRVETDQTLTTEAELRAWANERLNKHAEPKVSIRAEGLEIADATGETLDRLTLGRICRIPLPEFSTNIQERIVELYYRDKVHQPTLVEITMANSQEDITRIIAEEIKTGGGRGGSGGRGAARQQKEDHAWFEDTDEHVAMVAEGVVGVDAQGNPNWTRLAQIIVDGTGIHAGVKDMIDELEHFQTDFEMSESKISLVVGRYNGQNYIKAGEIVLAINDADESEIHLDSDHVYVGNQTSTTVINGKLEASDITAQFLSSRIAQIQLVSVIGLAATDGISSADFVSGNSLEGNILSLHGNTCENLIKSASVSGNTLTLTYLDGTTVNFNKTTPTVVLTPSWSGSDFTVTASTGESVTESFSTSTGSGQGGNVGGLVTISSFDASHYGYAYVKGTRVGSGNGVLYRVVANAGSVWNGGYNACRDDMQSDEVYTRYQGTYGGDGTTHYVYDSYNNTYIPVGTGWYTTARNWTYCYNKPAAK